MFQIYFSAATYDEVEKDVKLTIEAQLALIGGTLGLFAGVSIISIVELIYYIVRLTFAMIGEKIGEKGEDEILEMVSKEIFQIKGTKPNAHH